MNELIIFAHFLFFGEQCEWIAYFAQITWSMWANRSEEMSDRARIAQVAHEKWANEWIAQFFEQIAHLLIFGQKTSDSLGNQMSKFPALSSGVDGSSRENLDGFLLLGMGFGKDGIWASKFDFNSSL